MLDGRVLGASQVEYKPFGKPPLKRELRRLPLWVGMRDGAHWSGTAPSGEVAGFRRTFQVWFDACWDAGCVCWISLSRTHVQTDSLSDLHCPVWNLQQIGFP